MKAHNAPWERPHAVQNCPPPKSEHVSAIDFWTTAIWTGVLWSGHNFECVLRVSWRLRKQFSETNHILANESNVNETDI